MSNWSNLSHLVERHLHTKGHNGCASAADKFLASHLKDQPTVYMKLNKQGVEELKRKEHILTEITKTVLMCAQQNIALRGHEEEYGNFMVILRDKAEKDAILANHLENPCQRAKYTSPDIQNELLDLCASQVKSDIVERCNKAEYWSFVADEASDNSCKEQISVNVRFVEKNNDGSHSVKEEFLGFVRAHSTTGKALAETFMETFKSLGLDITKLRGQGYDGASNMSGKHKGVQARISEVAPSAHYVHCRAHVLNLVIVHNCKIPIVRNMMDTVQKISFAFSYSAKKSHKYQDILEEADPQDKQGMGRKQKITKLCDTRWAARADALSTFKASFNVLFECLEELGKEDADCRAYAASITKFDFIISLVVCQHILVLLKSLSDFLQNPAIDLLESVHEAQTIVNILRQEREDDLVFDALYEEAESIGREHDAPPSMPRLAGHQQHRNNTPADSPKEYWKRALYFVFVDHILEELNTKLVDNRPRFAAQYLIPTHLSKLDVNTTEQIHEGYEVDLTCHEDFDLEIKRWKARWEGADHLPSSLTETLKHVNKDLYPNVYAVLSVLLCMPVSTATAERTFSAMRRIKTFLRSSMTDTRLSSLGVLHVHRDFKVNIPKVIEEFKRKKVRKLFM